MKFLTIRQPWASLIAVGAKTIETRSWSTTYRGPLAIHAGKAMPTIDLMRDLVVGRVDVWNEWHKRYVANSGTDDLAISTPFGAVVAVCDLVDVVPIQRCVMDHEHVCENGSGLLLHSDIARPWADGETEHDVSDQLPFGDFTPGRYAWLLDNVRSIDPVPMKGAQGLRDVPADIAGRIA